MYPETTDKLKAKLVLIKFIKQGKPKHNINTNLNIEPTCKRQINHFYLLTLFHKNPRL